MSESNIIILKYLMSIILTIVTIIIINRNNKVAVILKKIFGNYLFTKKGQNYYKSHFRYKYLKFSTALSFYMWLLCTIYSMFNFVFQLNFIFLIIAILVGIMFPLLYRLIITIDNFLYKKR